MRWVTLLFLAVILPGCRANYRDWQTPACVVTKPDLRILQFSDTHVRHAGDATWVAQKLQAAIAEHRPDLLINTGDITLDGEIDQWQAYVAGLKSLTPPQLYVWGNHDIPLKQTKFASGGQSHFHDVGNYRLVLIDSAWEGPFKGSYTSVPESEFDRIRRMADTQKKILIFAHHPLAPDAPHFRLRNADAVLALFAAAEVVGVFTGHFHGAYLAPEGKTIYTGVTPLARHQMNHTWSQAKGYRLIELEKGCLRTRHVALKP